MEGPGRDEPGLGKYPRKTRVSGGKTSKMAVQPTELVALACALKGVTDGLRVLPENSVWRPCLREFRNVLSAQTELQPEPLRRGEAPPDDPG